MWTPWRKQYAIIRLELNDGSSMHFLSEQNGFRRVYYSFASKKLKLVGSLKKRYLTFHIIGV